MGLLDFMTGGNDGSQNGLLAFLRNNALNQQMSSGLLSDQANYGPPTIPSAPQAPLSLAPQPQQAPQPQPQAQPQGAQQAAPLSFAPRPPVPSNPPPVIQAQPQMNGPVSASPGIGDRLASSAQSFANSGRLLPALANGFTSLLTGQRSDPKGIVLAQQQQAKTANQQWLASNGATPQEQQAAAADPNVMKALIQRYAAAPTSIGNGWIIQNGKPVRAYTPDDKTPQGFVQDDKGGLHFIPNGPADPAYITAKEKATAEGQAAAPGGGGLSLSPVYGKDAQGNTVLLQMGKNGTAQASKLPEGITLNGIDNETLQSDAARLNAGDPNILKKYSNKGQGRIDLLRLNNEANRQRQEAGLSPIDITQNEIAMTGDTARERAAGTMEGRMAPASIEAHGAFQLAQEAFNNLPRTNFVPLNRVLQMGEAAMSNPNLKAAATAANTAVMTYSKAIAPTGVGTVAAQEHARQILETADGPAATKAAFDQLDREVDMAHQSPGLARQYFADARKARLEGRPPPPLPAFQRQQGEGGPITSGKTSSGNTWSVVPAGPQAPISQ